MRLQESLDKVHFSFSCPDQLNNTLSLSDFYHRLIIDQNQKQTLTDARSYSGTETSSDHRLIVARIEINWPRLYHNRAPNKKEGKFNTLCVFSS